ncbi:MAG: alpha/beta hydrolase [Hyphomonadaceae bacterium]|nr:alpha/beta hydrolase [Hyphomonadaceae bacterium]
MQLDPQTKAFLAAGEGAPPLHEMSVADARAALGQMSAMAGGPKLDVAACEAREIIGPAGPVPVRVYWPEKGAGALPILLFFHGGGFALGDISTHDNICRFLCVHAGVLVISVDYRRSPEHKFPAAPEDCYAALVWAAGEAANLGGRADRIALGGDSAGGNLAAAVALMARDRSGPAIAYQVLIYPVLDGDPAFETPSRREYGDAGYILTHKDIVWLTDMYAAGKEDYNSPYMSPLRASSLEGLPPALVITAGFDPLCSEGKMYAERLAVSGIPVEHRTYANTVHGFVSFSGVIDHGKDALSLVSRRLKEQLGVV